MCLTALSEKHMKTNMFGLPFSSSLGHTCWEPAGVRCGQRMLKNELEFEPFACVRQIQPKNIWKALCFARCLALRRATRFGNPLCCGQRVIEKDIDFQPFDCARQIARKKKQPSAYVLKVFRDAATKREIVAASFRKSLHSVPNIFLGEIAQPRNVYSAFCQHQISIINMYVW